MVFIYTFPFFTVTLVNQLQNKAVFKIPNQASYDYIFENEKAFLHAK